MALHDPLSGFNGLMKYGNLKYLVWYNLDKILRQYRNVRDDAQQARFVLQSNLGYAEQRALLRRQRLRATHRYQPTSDDIRSRPWPTSPNSFHQVR